MSHDLSRRQAAVIACVSCFVTLGGVGVAVAGGAGIDAASVSGNVGVGVLGWAVVVASDVVRAWALFVYFRRVHESLALLGLVWMLLHDAVLAASLPLYVVAAASPPELASALLALQGNAFHVGLLFFSLHLLTNGALALKSDDVPRPVGALVVVAGAGYLVDSAVRVAAGDVDGVVAAALAVVAVPNTLGELGLALWLGVRGGRPRAGP